MHKVFFNYLFITFLFSLLFQSCASHRSIISTNRTNLSEIREGEERAKEILNHAKLYVDPKAMQKIKNVANKLIAVARHKYDTSNYQWNFYLIDNKWKANAFCLPGGKVFIFTGLLPYLDNEDELAVVLSHEMVHALKHHQKYSKRSKTLAKVGQFILSTLVFINPFSLPFVKKKDMKQSDALVEEHLLLPYIQSHEYEADILGLKLMKEAGFNPHSAIIFWSKFPLKSQIKPEYLSTHPSTKHRLQRIHDFLIKMK